MTSDCFNCSRTVADGLPICQLCADLLVKELKGVPGIVSDMTITRARLDRMTNGRVGGKSAETALPIRLDRFGRRPTQRPLDALTNEITTWARDVAEESGQTDELNAALDGQGLRQLTNNHRQRRPDPAALTAEVTIDAEMAAIWLAYYAEDLRSLPAIEELYDGITDAIANARKAVDRLPELAYKGACPHVLYDEERQPFTCGADLYVERGEEYVSCPRCWTHHDIRQLDRDMLAQLDEHPFPIAELARVLRELGMPVPVGTLYSWHTRKQLHPIGWRLPDGTISQHWIHRNDPALFRLRDVKALIAKEAS